MSVDPRWLAEMAAKHKAQSEGEKVNARTCSHCGYDLKGLKASGVCPECGTPYRPVVGLRGRDELRNLTMEQLVSLRSATGLCCAGTIGSIASLLVIYVAGAIGQTMRAPNAALELANWANLLIPASAAAWVGGVVWLTLAPRIPCLGDEPEFLKFNNTESNAGVWIIRWTQAGWFVCAGIMCAQAMSAGFGRVMVILALSAGLVAALGLSLVSVLLRRLAAMLHDDHSAENLMIGVWLMPVIAISSIGIPALVVLFWSPGVLVVIWFVVVAYWTVRYLASIWWLWRAAAWAVGNAEYEHAKQREFLDRASELQRKERERA